MGANSKIEWCHHTFNLAWGCTKVSEACRDCYAEAIAKHWGFDVWGKDKPRRTFGEKHWNEPLKWNAIAKELGERHRVFCSSMADVFEDHPTIAEERLKLWPLIERTPWLDWLLLTKRPENAIQFAPRAWNGGWPDNAWVGTTIESNSEMQRVITLLDVPAKIRFVSCEPLLGPLDLTRIGGDHFGWGRIDCLNGLIYTRANATEIGCDWETQPISRIHWVIAGGESGSHARPAHPDWFRSLRDQCLSASVPFLFKQWGEWVPAQKFSDFEGHQYFDDRMAPRKAFKEFSFTSEWRAYGENDGAMQVETAKMFKVGKRFAGRKLDGREWSEFPERRINAELENNGRAMS